MEKRNFTRVDFSECASVKHKDQIFFADIQNMSLQGVYIKTNQEIPLNSTVELTVYRPPNSSFRYHASVVRCDDTGLGMQLKGMDVNSFVHLRDIVALQCNDHDLVTSETYRMSSCIN